jgi:hypothetical protein
LRGRRVPFIDPLRLYLTMSLIVFALIKMIGVDLPQVYFEDKAYGVRYVHDLFNPDNPNKPRTVTLDITVREGAEWDPHSIGGAMSLSNLLASLEGINATWAHHLKSFMRMPPNERNDILNHGFVVNLPYMLIGALPLCALYLKLMYLGSGRRYGAHGLRAAFQYVRFFAGQCHDHLAWQFRLVGRAGLQWRVPTELSLGLLATDARAVGRGLSPRRAAPRLWWQALGE